MLTENLHPTLESLFEFEEQRTGIPFEVNYRPLLECPGWPFRPLIEVNIHTGNVTDTFPVLVHDELLEVRSAVCVANEEQEIGFRDFSGNFCLLAGVTGNRLSIYFDLNRMFTWPEEIRRRPLNGSPPTGNPGNKVADLIFSQALPLLVHNIRRYPWKQEADRYARAKLSSLEESFSKWNRNLRENDRAIEEKTWEIRNLAQKNSELRERIRLYRLVASKQRERQAREEYSQLTRLVGRSLRQAEVRDGYLRVLTTPIETEYGGERYEFGCFRIDLPLNGGRLEIRPENRNHEAEGYFHPHVSTDGYPCLGNVGSTLAQLLGDGKMFDAVSLMLEFLRSYNPENPYLRIERWNPDWEDEDDRFDSCYDNASHSDCASCDDWDCPHRNGAENRCHDMTNTQDCIACAACDRHTEAIHDCREDHDPHQCVACDVDCIHAGDTDACFEAQGAEACIDCPNTDCEHYEEEKDNEDQSAEIPAVAVAGS